MGTNRRKAVKEKFKIAERERRAKVRRERKQAKKVANRLLGIRKAVKPPSEMWEWKGWNNGKA